MQFTPNPKPVTEQTPREIDEQLAYWYAAGNEVRALIESARHWIAIALERGDGAREARGHEEFEKHRRRLTAILHAQLPLNNEFTRRGGWKRYYVVPKGHVHREMTCSTCHPTTVFGWLTELSACDEIAMVEVHGDLACAVCFPEVQTHPAFIASTVARKTREKQLERAQCSMSGQPIVGPLNRMGFRCPTCGLVVASTRSGSYRQHFKGGLKPGAERRCPGSGTELRNEEGEPLDGRFVTCFTCKVEFSSNSRGRVPIHTYTVPFPTP